MCNPAACQVLQKNIGYLPKRPIWRPLNEVRRCYAKFTYEAASWTTGTAPFRIISEEMVGN